MQVRPSLPVSHESEAPILHSDPSADRFPVVAPRDYGFSRLALCATFRTCRGAADSALLPTCRRRRRAYLHGLTSCATTDRYRSVVVVFLHAAIAATES